MMSINSYLLIFAVAFMGCVLATPIVTRIAVWAGAIDRPDHFRRIHKGATPRLGGLGLAFGIFVGGFLVILGGYLDAWTGLAEWVRNERAVLLAAVVVLMVGYADDTRGLGPRTKLLGQALAVLILFAGGVRIQSFDILGWPIEFTKPAVSLKFLGVDDEWAILSLFVTMFWFLGCMNIWNLIDGMDGLASGVGLLVSATLTLVAIHHENVGVAITSAALAGSLAGFLLYNWHPACIFLGDSGSLLIGLLVGVIGVQGSFKGPSAISILFPILAMGLPISDTALAIFRRWVRNLPMSAADRRHVHHLLIGLGLNPRQAALLLYCFSGFLCGAVLLGVALKNEQLALILGIAGCLAFLIIVTSRLNEFTMLRDDLMARLNRGRQERFAAKLTWESIQRIELCGNPAEIREILENTARALGCDDMTVSCRLLGKPLVGVAGFSEPEVKDPVAPATALSGPTAIFRLASGQDLFLTVALHQGSESPLAADIAFRFLQKLSMAAAERLERLLATQAEHDADSAMGTRSTLQENAQTPTVPETGSGREVDNELVSTPKAMISPVLALERTSTLGIFVCWIREYLLRVPRNEAREPSLTEE